MRARWIFFTALPLSGFYWVAHLPRFDVRSGLGMPSTTEAGLQTNIMGNIIIPNLNFQKETMAKIMANFVDINSRIEYKKKEELRQKKEELRKYNEEVLKRKQTILRYISHLEEGLKEDKGTGCEIPQIDPFSKKIMSYIMNVDPVQCSGEEWIICYMSKCKVNKHVVKNIENLKCNYTDILFYDDYSIRLGRKLTLQGDHEYNLIESDHVEIVCKDEKTGAEWKHNSGGIRTLEAPNTPADRKNPYNVLFFGFDSASKNGFIRMMPKSLDFIKNELKAVVLDGYQVVGDGTTAALFPILTGKTELEHPDWRKVISNKKVDHRAFIFYKMRQLGYRTSFMEDICLEGPVSGTFQRRFNGFGVQPADHYTRTLLIEDHRREIKFGPKFKKENNCYGPVPQYKFMMNITDQFLQLPDKKFAFTFICHISHDDFNMIREADGPMVDFLTGIVKRGLLKDTLIILMGDHGTRFGGLRDTYQGKLEERLPFMAIRLPDDLIANRPDTKAALEKNSYGVVTTPNDIYATVLDVLDLRQDWNPYKVKGADLKRGMTLLEPIPRNRSCSEAGIEPHWCTCLRWEQVTSSDPMYKRVATVLVAKINSITEKKRSQCLLRTLVSIDWVKRKRPHQRMLEFKKAKDRDRYIGVFEPHHAPMPKQVYQMKITVDPGRSVFEAIATHSVKGDILNVKPSDITRTNPYKNEPACISAIHPELNYFCFCKNP